VTPTEGQVVIKPPRVWQRLLLKPVDGAWLSAFRVLFGGAVSISMLRFLGYGWVERLFVEPRFFFKYWGFEWVQPLPADALRVLFVVLAVAALGVALGFLFRVSAFVLTVGLVYFQLLDVSTYLNHYYLVALLAGLLAVSPAGQCFAIDNLLARRFTTRGRIAEPTRWIPRGWLYLFRVQVGLVYTFAGLAKLQSDWLLHAQPLRIWLGANTELPLIGPLFTLDGVPLLMSWFGFLFDATIVVWLSLEKTRPWAYVVVIIFHVMTRVLFPIGMFPVFMALSALVFFAPDWPRTALERIGVFLQRCAAFERGVSRWLPFRARPDVALPPEPLQSSVLQRLGFSLLAVYCVVQLLLPLRFLVYGGNVLWHEQGMRYSWRVMVRAKGGSTVFNVSNPVTQQRWTVKPDMYLNDLQESEMSAQPDLILQLAHHISNDFTAKGLGPVEVRVDSRVALNGRRSAPLVDPSIDLTRVQDGLGLARFVLPSPSEAPAHTRPVL
jgi:vitamin K-dependent gamma-carboxylase